MTDKKLIAYFATILISTSTYVVWNLSEQRKLSKRIKRHESFLAATAEYHKKYTQADLNKPEAIAEYQVLLDNYNK
jgi:pyridoxine/pyridoxamine 5'-phosphate oxidase